MRCTGPPQSLCKGAVAAETICIQDGESFDFESPTPKHDSTLIYSRRVCRHQLSQVLSLVAVGCNLLGRSWPHWGLLMSSRMGRATALLAGFGTEQWFGGGDQGGLLFLVSVGNRVEACQKTDLSGLMSQRCSHRLQDGKCTVSVLRPEL